MSSGDTTWTFTYDADGMRTKRASSSATYNYVYNGSQLSQMTVGSNTLSFAYDASGTPLSVIYNGTAYYYATNLQGDVTAILNTSGTAVVTYTYDAWGKPLTIGGSMASTLGTHNPLRYRGYVYDNETGLYYLQSRYYNPQVGRFLNADAFLSTGHGLLGNNMFAYCNNNSVTYVDPSGYCVECVSKRFRSQVSVTSGDCLLGVAITAGLGLGVTIARAIEETAEEIKAWVEAQHGLTESRDNSVYVLKDPQNGNLVKYVGRTNDPDRRWSEHMHDSAHSARSGYTMIVLLTGLTKDEAILWEQVVISAYTITYLENARREIARKNIDKFQNYINAVTEIHTGISASEIYDLIAGR